MGRILGERQLPELRNLVVDQCCDVCGMGVCRRSLVSEDVDLLTVCKRMLWASTKLPVYKSEGDFEMMVLLVLRSNVGPPAHKVLLTLLSLMSPKPRQCFWECTYSQDLVGNEFV